MQISTEHVGSSVMWAVQLYWLSFNKEWLSKLLSILTMRNENSIKCNSEVKFSKCFFCSVSLFAEQFNNFKFESQSTTRKTKQAGKVCDLTAKERGTKERVREMRERACRH